MVRSPDDRQAQLPWTRLEQISYWVSVTAILVGTIALVWAMETDRRVTAVAILGVGVAGLFALIWYAVRRVLRER